MYTHMSTLDWIISIYVYVYIMLCDILSHMCIYISQYAARIPPPCPKLDYQEFAHASAILPLLGVLEIWGP